MVLGSGKTSLSASLSSRLAGYASNHPCHGNEDLLETKVMRQWTIKLLPNDRIEGDLQPLTTNKRTQLYEWQAFGTNSFSKTMPKALNLMTLKTKFLGANQLPNMGGSNFLLAKLIDSGGHVEYTLSTTFSITPKSLIMVMFNSKIYTSHMDCYNRMIGCYIDIILSRTKDVAILLVAGHADECNPFLLENDKKQLKDIFEICVEHMENRLKTGDSAELPVKIKLISHAEDKVFLLANKTNGDRITKSQQTLLQVVSKGLMKEDIVGIKAGSGKEGNMPRSWRRLQEEIGAQYAETGEYYCKEKRAFQCFSSLKRKIQGHDEEKAFEGEENVEISLIRDILSAYDHWRETRNSLFLLRYKKDPQHSRSDEPSKSFGQPTLELSGKGKMDNVNQHIKTSSHGGTLANIIQSPARPIGQTMANVIESPSKPIGQVLADEPKAEETSPNVFSGVIVKKIVEEILERVFDKNEGKLRIFEYQEFELALEYLCDTGEIVRFPSFKDYIFPVYDALLNTWRIFLDHKHNRDKFDGMMEFDGMMDKSKELKLAQNGVIEEKRFDEILQDEQRGSDSKLFVSLEVFKKLLISLGMATRKTKEDRKYLILPSLIGNRAEINSKSPPHEIYQKTMIMIMKKLSKTMHKISYTFEDKTCFTSAGFVDLFLVQLYEDSKWEFDFLESATSCKAPIEGRSPGIVFSSIYRPERNSEKPFMAIFEEEARATKFYYVLRSISIFTSAYDWIGTFESVIFRTCQEMGIEQPRRQVSCSQ